MIVNNVVLVENKIAPQYDKRDEAQLLNMLKATGLKIGIFGQFWSLQGRIQTVHLLNVCFMCAHLWLEKSLISSSTA